MAEGEVRKSRRRARSRTSEIAGLRGVCEARGCPGHFRGCRGTGGRGAGVILRPRSMNTQDIVQKLWNLCHVLRDDGITYHEYVTELTFLLFLKMMKETRSGSRGTCAPWSTASTRSTGTA